MSEENNKIAMKVVERRQLTPAIVEFTLAPVEAGGLPDFDPGSHVTIQTPSGAMRRYSLVGPGNNPDTYVVAIKREPDSRGGSSSMHDEALVGTELEVAPPENEFPLKEAPKYLLIAGGIGVTPIYSMAQKLQDDGKDFSIIYCARSPEEAAYRDELAERFGQKVKFHYDDGDPAKVYDFWDHFSEIKNMHVYCCGPKPLMQEIKDISGHWPEGRVNFEDFKPVEIIRPDDVAFDVELAKTGRTITVPADRSILEAIRENGLPTVSSCESGTCGTCKTRLISGEVDHRDMVLMDDEKDEFIMICISRARSGNLVIDL